MCAANNKILINAALGFDSYLVMRHGHGFSDSSDASTALEEESSDASRLGCYFCNDIIAATNSTRDRTLDQQCTVTRPGLSFISGALCVEMMVALLHSKHGNKHPAPSMNGVTSDTTNPDHAAENGADNDSESSDSDTGSKVLIPHQIRGSLTGFTQFLPQVYPLESAWYKF